MTALTIRLPEDKYERLKALAERRGISVNAQINELATLPLSDHDTEIRFALHQMRGRGVSLRIDPDLHARADVAARRAGTSLNRWVTGVLARGLERR
jgi:predicted HicB family RNase H-like nuclease